MLLLYLIFHLIFLNLYPGQVSITVLTASFRISGAAAGNLPQLRSLVLDGVVADAPAEQPGLGGGILLQNNFGRGHSLPQLEELLAPVESHGDLLEVAWHLLEAGLPRQSLGLVLGRHGLRGSGGHLKQLSDLKIIQRQDM